MRKKFLLILLLLMLGLLNTASAGIGDDGYKLEEVDTPWYCPLTCIAEIGGIVDCLEGCINLITIGSEG